MSFNKRSWGMRVMEILSRSTNSILLLQVALCQRRNHRYQDLNLAMIINSNGSHQPKTLKSTEKLKLKLFRILMLISITETTNSIYSLRNTTSSSEFFSSIKRPVRSNQNSTLITLLVLPKL